jgi:hypothetical protein
MRYDELYTRHRALCDRYIPSLASKTEAYAALRNLNNDPHISQNEREALTEYVADFVPGQLRTIPIYMYCDICGFMVGFTRGHEHCDSCELPCLHLSSCGVCGDCCSDNCLVCESCNEHISAIFDSHRFHGDCLRCNICCDCDSDDEDSDELDDEENESFQETPSYGKPLLAQSKKDRLTFNSVRLAGVEWEYNYVDSNKSLENWKQRWGGTIHYDASCGEEAVTSPMAGDYIAKVITELGAAFKTGCAKIDDKCSVHVHVDAHDYSWHDMFKLLKVYSKVEPLLYLLAGQQRLANRYCVPIGKDFSKIITTNCPDPKGAIMALALNTATSKDARALQREKPGKRTEGRRRGLNISPWLAARKNKSPDATVEFRMHRDTHDAARVIGWTKLCVRLVDWCVKSSDKDIENLPNSPLRSLCQMIAPDCSRWILSRIKEWRESTKFAGKFKRRIHIRGGKYEY